MAQIPEEAVGTAAGVLVYSIFCFFVALLMIWLICAHGESKSYVAIMSYAGAVGATASIAQQIHTSIRWRDIKIEQHEHSRANPNNAELAVAGGSVGLDLVLFYFQYYSYTVTAMATFFWASALAQSIFRVRALESVKGTVNWVTKVVAIVLPAIFLSLLRIPDIQDRKVVFLVIADVLLITSLSGTIITLIVILGKYINTRRQFLSWNVRYGQKSSRSQGTGVTNVSNASMSPKRSSIYDQWLLVRFAIAVLAICAFQTVTIMFQVGSAQSAATLPPNPDLGLGRLRGDLLGFIPGVTPSLLTFVMFGTTKTFRDYLVSKLTPRRLKDAFRKRVSGQHRLESEPPTPRHPFDDSREEGVTPYSVYEDGIRLHEVHITAGGKVQNVDEFPIWQGPRRT